MLYSQLIDNALEDAVGKAGLPRASLERELDRAAGALDKIRQWKKDGTLPLLGLPARRDDLAALRPHAERLAAFEFLRFGGVYHEHALGLIRSDVSPTRKQGNA